MSAKRAFAVLAALLVVAVPAAGAAAADELPLIDTHIHYSHDAWEGLPPAEAVKLLRAAGLKKAFVSSSSDDGTRMLFAEAPDLVVPVLRPYRRRGETGSWFEDPTVVEHIESRLERYSYAGIGEFHVLGANADSPVMRRVVALAKERGLFLHAHADSRAVHRIFAQDPEARVLWAHAGFEEPEILRDMLARYDRLWCELAFREDHAAGGGVDPAWRRLFEDYPERFMVGSDPYTPERWGYVVEHAAWTRAWLADLPPALAEKIAWRNAEALARWAPER